MESLVQISKTFKDQLTTTSLKVAEVFGKRHDHVLRDIEQLISKDLGPSPSLGKALMSILRIIKHINVLK